MAEETKPIEPTRTLSLPEKILALQNRVGIVHKKGKNKEQSYDYLRIEDAVIAVNKLLAEMNLLLTPTLQTRPDGTFYFERGVHAGKDGPRGYMASVVLQWTLEDVLTGEKRTYNIPGEGYDSTDKGIPKAITSSRKQAIILIANLPVGNDIEERGTVDRETAKANQKDIVNKKLAAAAKSDDPAIREIAAEAMSQVVPEKVLRITRPEEHNGHYVVASGLIAVPQLEQFFLDTGSKRFQTKTKPIMVYWRVPSEYEKGLVTLCEKLQIEVEG